MTNQENTNQIIENGQCNCKNNYNSDTFMESFAKDDDALSNCATCPNFKRQAGMYMCQYFNK